MRSVWRENNVKTLNRKTDIKLIKHTICRKQTNNLTANDLKAHQMEMDTIKYGN